MSRSATVFALAISLPCLIASPSFDAPVSVASASVSIAMTLDELVEGATDVVIGVPAEQESRWEETPSGRRIVTYTRVAIEQKVVGDSSGETFIRTLGGVVGKIGQQVSGEATFVAGERTLLFLKRADRAEGRAHVVLGMAQGQFRVVEEKQVRRVAGSREPGVLLPRRGPSLSAREVLQGLAVETAVEKITLMRKSIDARK